MNREARTQRISFLMADLQERLLDIAFLDERIKHTTAAAKQYYENEKRKETAKLDKVREELSRLKCVQ